MIEPSVLPPPPPPSADFLPDSSAAAQDDGYRGPMPILGNSGAYMCPYTEDGTVAKWVEKGMTASLASNMGAAAGTYAGQRVLDQVPFIGGWLGSKLGAATGRELAVQAVGGRKFIKENSDLSFNSLGDMAHYVVAKHSQHPQFAQVLKATYGIYPDFQAAVQAAH